MALKKLVLYKGVEAEYHKILRMFVDTQSNNTIITIGIYKDKDTRNSDWNNFLGEPSSLVLEGADYSRSGAYTKLKTLPEYEGATDA